MTHSLTQNAIPAHNKRGLNGNFNARQLCFFSAFVAPISKLVETPSLLAEYALGDLLLPALTQYLLQSTALALLLLVVKRTGRSFFSLIQDKLGDIGARIFYGVLSAYFLFSVLLPLLELEKFSQVLFYDTAPYAFTFTPFFFLSGFICVKGLKSFARFCDLCCPIFLISFCGIILMSLGETDFESILPWFEFPPSRIFNAVKYTTSHFSDAVLFLPLLGDYQYEKGDGKKIYLSYLLGAGFVLLFLACFYSIFTTIAPTQDYAFAKIAQYFPALQTLGRIDLLFVYLLSVVLFCYTVLPVRLCALCLEKATDCKNKLLLSVLLNGLLFAFILFLDRRQNDVFELVTKTLWWVFPIFSLLLPVLCLFFLIGNKKTRKTKGCTPNDRKKECSYAR